MVQSRNCKVGPLTYYEKFKKFIKQLRKIDDSIALVAEILWSLNHELQDNFVTLESVLRLNSSCITYIKDWFYAESGCWVELNRSRHLVCHPLPKELHGRVKARLESPCFFEDKEGRSLSLRQVHRCFQRAGKLAKIDESINSLFCRPTGYEPVSAAEWKKLCKCVTGLTSFTGRKAVQDQRMVFNAIIYQMITGIPYRKLPSYFPFWKDVHSQYRRWKSNGVDFDQILRDRGC